MSGNNSSAPGSGPGTKQREASSRRPREVSWEYTGSVMARFRGRYLGCCCSRMLTSTDTYLLEIRDWIYRRTDLDTASCELIMLRFGRIFKTIRSRMHRAGIIHSLSTLFTGIASLVVTACISINNTNTAAPHSELLWWGSWILSLSISVISVFASFYKFDRKYLLLFSTFAALDREMWMYLELVGHYAPDFDLGHTTHSDRLPLFLYKMERVHKRLNDSLLEIERSAEETVPPGVTTGASTGTKQDIVAVSSSQGSVGSRTSALEAAAGKQHDA